MDAMSNPFPEEKWKHDTKIKYVTNIHHEMGQKAGGQKSEIHQRKGSIFNRMYTINEISLGKCIWKLAPRRVNVRLFVYTWPFQEFHCSLRK